MPQGTSIRCVAFEGLPHPFRRTSTRSSSEVPSSCDISKSVVAMFLWTRPSAKSPSACCATVIAPVEAAQSTRGGMRPWRGLALGCCVCACTTAGRTIGNHIVEVATRIRRRVCGGHNKIRLGQRGHLILIVLGKEGATVCQVLWASVESCGVLVRSTRPPAAAADAASGRDTDKEKVGKQDARVAPVGYKLGQRLGQNHSMVRRASDDDHAPL